MVSPENPDAAEGGIREEQPGLPRFTLQRQVFGREQPQMGFFQRVEVPGGEPAGDAVPPGAAFRRAALRFNPVGPGGEEEPHRGFCGGGGFQRPADGRAVVGSAVASGAELPDGETSNLRCMFHLLKQFLLFREISGKHLQLLVSAPGEKQRLRGSGFEPLCDVCGQRIEDFHSLCDGGKTGGAGGFQKREQAEPFGLLRQHRVQGGFGLLPEFRLRERGQTLRSEIAGRGGERFFRRTQRQRNCRQQGKFKSHQSELL